MRVSVWVSRDTVERGRPQRLEISRFPSRASWPSKQRNTSNARRNRPVRVNRQPVALLREEWRVVDRWWTEEPIARRYFEVVLQSGENAVVFRDEARSCWFTQRGA